jgi:hypothetical protein
VVEIFLIILIFAYRVIRAQETANPPITFHVDEEEEPTDKRMYTLDGSKLGMYLITHKPNQLSLSCKS